MISEARRLYKYRQIPTALIYNELRKGTASLRLGYLWWVIDPIIMMGIYYAVVKGVLQYDEEDYHVFILTALISWQWFSRSLSVGTTSIASSGNVIRQTYFPLTSLIITPIVSNGIYAVFGFLIVLVFAFRAPGLELIFLVPILLVQAIFTFGLASLLSVINVLIPDTSRVVGFALRAWWFLSPVLYSAERVLEARAMPEFAKTLFMANPFTTLMPAYRAVLLEGRAPDWQALAILGAASLVGLQLILMFFRRLERRVVKFL